MESPFPGMDPYLEPYWGEVHHRLIAYTGDHLQGRLPGDLRARVEQRVFVESDDPEVRRIIPDVHVTEQRPSQTSEQTGGGVATAQPLVVQLNNEPETQGYIEIIDAASGNRVITVIEFLSPSNKVKGDGQELYLQKQHEVRTAGASLVEIDLTRTGNRIMVLPPWRIPPSHRTTYQVCVSRGSKPKAVEVYRVPLTERLPAINIPLRETDADVLVDLQPLIDQCYANGRYDDIDYKSEPNPPLESEDAAWADEWLRGKGLR